MEGEKEAWWLDDRTKRLFEETMRLSGTLTFTVRPGTPLQLTREQARFQKRLLQGIRATLSAISSLHKQLWEVSFTQPAGDDLQALSTVCPRTGRHRAGVRQVSRQQLNVWSPLQVADLPVEEYEALWSEYVNAYAEHLLKADNDPSSPAGKRLVRAAGLKAFYLG